MTIEDPIEFLHRDKKSPGQPARGRGGHASRSPSRCARALRQDPDVILVGEMRDFETIETALTAAETGHLVLSTLHTLDATETVNRIISVFPPHQQKQIRLQLAAVLQGGHLACAWCRAPTARAACRPSRSCRTTAYIRDCIVNKEKTKLIRDAIAAGTQPVRHADLRPVAVRLYKQDLITLEEALRQCDEPRRVQAQGRGASSPPPTRPRGDGRAARPPKRRRWTRSDPDSPFEFSRRGESGEAGRRAPVRRIALDDGVPSGPGVSRGRQALAAAAARGRSEAIERRARASWTSGAASTTPRSPTGGSRRAHRARARAGIASRLDARSSRARRRARRRRRRRRGRACAGSGATSTRSPPCARAVRRRIARPRGSRRDERRHARVYNALLRRRLRQRRGRGRARAAPCRARPSVGLRRRNTTR